MSSLPCRIYSLASLCLLAACTPDAPTPTNLSHPGGGSALVDVWGSVRAPGAVDPPALSASVPSPTSAGSTTLTVGAPGDQVNGFPFGGRVIGPGTRYQQAYASSQLAAVGKVLIRSVAFLEGAGTFATSTYNFHFSTTPVPINSLSETAFDGNRGADNALFASRLLTGTAPATLTVTGDVPFFYDPTKGNLLLDIVVTPGNFNSGTPGHFPALYVSRSGTATGVFSRFHDFGFGTIGWGLVTRFEVTTPTVDNLLSVVGSLVSSGKLRGRDNGGSLNGWRNMLDAAQRSMRSGNVRGACALLQQAYQQADGQQSPPDTVTGPAAAPIAAFIQATRSALGC